MYRGGNYAPIICKSHYPTGLVGEDLIKQVVNYAQLDDHIPFETIFLTGD